MTRDLRLVCTNRGRHPSREIALLTRWPDDDEMVLTPADRLSYAEQRGGAAGQTVRVKRDVTSAGQGKSFWDVLWTFHCPSCDANVEWRLDRALRVVDTLLAASVSSADLSALPAKFR